MATTVCSVCGRVTRTLCTISHVPPTGKPGKSFAYHPSQHPVYGITGAAMPGARYGVKGGKKGRGW